MSKKVGIIPAAGKGLRLGLPFPKELLPITYHDDSIITVIDSCLAQFANAKIYNAIIIIREGKESIKDYIHEGRHDVSVEYVYQESTLTKEGLPDALVAAYPLASSYDECVMLMGDVYFTNPNIVKRMQILEGRDATVATWHTEEPWRFGIVEYSEDNLVTSVVDKPNWRGIFRHWGAIAFKPSFWEYIINEDLNLSHALNRYCQDYKVGLLACSGLYIDIGTPKSFIEGIEKINNGMYISSN